MRPRLRQAPGSPGGGGPVAIVVLFAIAVILSGCKEAEDASSSSGYEPSQVEPVGDSGLQQVRFTAIGAARVGLTTARARLEPGGTTVPYAALVYDGQGLPWVYTVPDELSFLRSQVTVDRIEGDQVFLSDGLAVGDEVVTVGAAEVYGAERGIAGGH